MRNKYAVAFFGLLSLMLDWAGGARAETTQCMAIANLPTTINMPGIYCLTSDFATNLNEPAIYIDANHVVLDLNGHVIDNLAAGVNTTATGVSVSGRRNVTIKNGTLRGFWAAVDVADIAPYSSSQANVVEDLRVDRSTFNGLRIHCRGCVVRRNQVVASGQQRAVLGLNRDVVGILLFGPGNRVIDNDVISVRGYGTGLGKGIGFGLDTENCVAVNNRISDAAFGVTAMFSSTKYRDNLTLGVLTPYAGNGTDAGNNN